MVYPRLDAAGADRPGDCIFLRRRLDIPRNQDDLAGILHQITHIKTLVLHLSGLMTGCSTAERMT